MSSRRGRRTRSNLSQAESSNAREETQPTLENLQQESNELDDEHSNEHNDQDQPMPTLIRPNGTGFSPNDKVIGTAIVKIFKNKYDGPWNCWTEVPPEYQYLWFHEFQKLYCWEPRHHPDIWANWKNRVKFRLKDIIGHVRETRKRPDWIKQNIWDDLCRHWDSEEFRSTSAQKKKNRANAALHTGGSISMEEHARQLARELGRDPSFSEVYMKTHQRKSNQAWVDEKSKAIWDEYVKQKDTAQGSSDNTSDINTFISAAGGKKRGSVYGLGNISCKIFGNSKHGYTYNEEASSSQLPPYPHSNYIQDMVRNEFINISTQSYQSMFEDQQKQIEELRNQLQQITQSNYRQARGRRSSQQQKGAKTVSLDRDEDENDSSDEGDDNEE